VEEVEHSQIDIFTRLGGRQYAEVVADAGVLRLGDWNIHFASKASLIGWKGSSVREKDRLDANALRQLQDDPKAFD